MYPILYKQFDDLDELKSYLVTKLPISTQNELMEVINLVRNCKEK